MAPDFSKCEQCGIIFLDPGNQNQLCPKCRDEEEVPEQSKRDVLRLLKNTIRDAQSRNVMLTVDDLSERTQIPAHIIWSFIQAGDIDTASFDDPQVKQFLARQRLERDHDLKQQVQKTFSKDPADKSDDKAGKERRGYHLKKTDDKR